MKVEKTLLSLSLVLAVFMSAGQPALPHSDTVSHKTILRSDEDSDKVFTKVDKPAEFPGGAEGWRKYLEKNLNYPKKAFKKNIQGMVQIQFIVDKEGRVSEVKAMNDPGGGLAEEAVRMIQNSPKWKPAEQNGRKVIYRHIQSITFKLE